VRAVLVGTRRTDPHGEFLGFFDETDHGWPPFMRVHPVINWHYWEIWDVISLESPLFYSMLLFGMSADGPVSEGDKGPLLRFI
jgi:FAD synthetase